jgi:hypothetical protein
MATFDQLPAEQRAILELVVGRGQSYDELSGMLGMPPARVRELAREALGDLAPATAARVDPDWRGQIADYVLGQQTGPESTATRGHFKRSEAARAWAYSLLDSLGHLYPNGNLPAIPDADGTGPAAAPAPRKPEPEPERERPAASARPSGLVRTATLSPAAQAVVRRRRIVGGAIGLAALVVIILLIAGVFSGGGGKKKSSATSTTPAGPTKLLSQGVLKAAGGQKGAGIAFVLQVSGQDQLVVQAARLQPTTRTTAYEVWLYNSNSDVRAVGAQFTDQSGNLQGRGGVPSDYRRFKNVVVSREKVGSNPKAPSTIVLRGPLSAVPAGTQLPSGTTGGTGTTTTP